MFVSTKNISDLVEPIVGQPICIENELDILPSKHKTIYFVSSLKIYQIFMSKTIRKKNANDL